jgi:hypothetical protein
MRLQHTLRRLNRYYDQGIEKAERTGKWEQRAELIDESWFETAGIVGRLNELDTLYWRRKARRYHVPVPEQPIERKSDKNWEHIEDRQDGKTYWYLTDAGIFAVRTLLREEQKYRRDGRLAYVAAGAQILAAITGIGGIAVAILSIVYGRRG